jgi:hypothetical protein
VTHDELHAAGECPSAPWLAVAFMSGLSAMPPERLLQLGDLDCCLAWMLVEQAAA